MRRSHLVTLAACVLALLFAAGTAIAQDEDPFADEGELFEDEEDDPFAEYEERAKLDDEQTENASTDDDRSGSQDQDQTPIPLWTVLVGLAMAAWQARSQRR